MRKADCTPEQWAAYLESHRQRRLDNLEEARAKRRAYCQRPEVKARRKKYCDTPEARERRRALSKSPEGRRRAAAQYAKVRADPAAWAKIIDTQRRKRTGMGKKEVDRLLTHQNNCCAVCDRDFTDRQIRADHCHDTGSPRGLLCHHCNIIEGMLRGMKLTPEEFAARLSSYLKHPPILSLVC